MNPRVKGILLQAADRIERGWTRGSAARTKGGRVCSVYASDAARFCAVGAIRRETFSSDNAYTNRLYYSYYDKALKRLRTVVGGPLLRWNDHDAKSGNEVAAKLREAANE